MHEKMTASSLVSVFAALLLAILLISPASAKIEVVMAGGTQEIDSFEKNKITYFSLSGLTGMIGGSLDWEMIGHRVRYIEGTNRFDFVINSPYFRLNDAVHNLTFPAEFREGQIYLPAETFIAFLNGTLPQKITWDRPSATLRIEAEYFNVTDLSVTAKANGLLVEIFLTGTLAYDIYKTEGNWLNVTITEGLINTAQVHAREDKRYMYKLSTHQTIGSGQISMRLRRSIDKLTHKLAFDPPRIQISIADAAFDLDTNPNTPKVGPDDKIDVIVIDPGHGGKDYGAVGPGGSREKDIVLNIGRELAKLIRKDKQFKVIMTRDGDRSVSLNKRAEIANEAGADLFISIHANASPKKSPRGWNVFFLAPAKNDSARAVAQFENSFFLREQSALDAHRTESDSDLYKDPILGILNEMIMTEFQVESHEFAMMAAREFKRNLKIPSRGVDQAGFFVLNKVFTPSVLIESGFISNKNEEKTLKSSKYQKTVAKALYNAIKKFKAKYEKEPTGKSS